MWWKVTWLIWKQCPQKEHSNFFSTRKMTSRKTDRRKAREPGCDISVPLRFLSSRNIWSTEPDNKKTATNRQFNLLDQNEILLDQNILLMWWKVTWLIWKQCPQKEHSNFFSTRKMTSRKTDSNRGNLWSQNTWRVSMPTPNENWAERRRHSNGWLNKYHNLEKLKDIEDAFLINEKTPCDSKTQCRKNVNRFIQKQWNWKRCWDQKLQTTLANKHCVVNWNSW